MLDLILRTVYIELMRMWREGNLLALLVEMQTGAATLANSMEVPPKKLKLELPYDPTIEQLYLCQRYKCSNLKGAPAPQCLWQQCSQ